MFLLLESNTIFLILHARHTKQPTELYTVLVLSYCPSAIVLS